MLSNREGVFALGESLAVVKRFPRVNLCRRGGQLCCRTRGFVQEMLLQWCLGVPKQLQRKSSPGISAGIIRTGISPLVIPASRQLSRGFRLNPVP